MMRTLGILALAGAGVALLLGTERGRSCVNQAGQMAQDRFNQLTGKSGGEVTELVQEALSQPHEDTIVSRALEAAAV